MTFEELKAKNSIVDVAVRLGLVRTAKETTQNFKCFYHEDRHPSCVLMPSVNRYKCQSCGKGGDVIDLVQNQCGLNSPFEAAKWLDPTFGEDDWENETPSSWDKAHPFSEEVKKQYKYEIGEDEIRFEIPGYGTKIRYFGKKRKENGKYCNPIGSAENFVFITCPEQQIQFVVEGEADALVLTSQTGYSAATKTTGVGSAIGLVERLVGKDIYIVTDNDRPGKKYAEEIITAIPSAKLVTLPTGVKDISEYFFRNYSDDDFDKLVLSATQPEPPELVVATGYKSLDKVLCGFHSGGLGLFAGEEKSGKTSFVLSLAAHLVELGYKVVYVSTELTRYEVDRYLDTLTGENNWSQKHPDFEFYDLEKLPTLEDHLKLVQDKAMFGIRVFIIDNITSYRDEIVLGKTEWERIAIAGDKYRRLAKKYGLIMIAVIHLNRGTTLREIPLKVKQMIKENVPDQIFDESISVFRRPDVEDIKGGSGMRSQTIFQLLLWRPYQSFNLPKLNKLCAVIVANNRYGPTGDVLFNFDGATKKFTEVEIEVSTEKSNEPYQENISDVEQI